MEMLSVIDKIYTTENIIKLKTDLRELVPNVDSEWNDEKTNVSSKLLTMSEEQKNEHEFQNGFTNHRKLANLTKEYPNYSRQ